MELKSPATVYYVPKRTLSWFVHETISAEVMAEKLLAQKPPFPPNVGGRCSSVPSTDRK
jgi:hypothetical protein